MGRSLRSFVIQQPLQASIILSALIQIFRTLFGVYLDNAHPPAFSTANNYIEVIVYAILALALVPINGMPWGRATGFIRPISERSLLFLLPLLVLAGYPLVVDPIRALNVGTIVQLILYSLVTAFSVEVLSRGIILGMLRSQGIWIAAIITAFLLAAQGFFADLFSYGSAYVLAQGLFYGYQAAYAFASASLRLRIRSIWPLIGASALLSLSRSLTIFHSFISLTVIILILLVYGVIVLLSTSSNTDASLKTTLAP